MKFNHKNGKRVTHFLIILMAGIWLSSCGKPASAVLMTEHYPELYEAIYNRNADDILIFTEHEWDLLRDQAWRALISTPIEKADMDSFIIRVKEENSDASWAALASKELNEDQIVRLIDYWNRVPSLRRGISQVLGQQGNEDALNFLIRNLDYIIDADHEFESALAIGRLIGKHGTSNFNRNLIFRYAAIIDDADLMRAFLYGFYRSGIEVEDQSSRGAITETFFHSQNPAIRQYALRISLQNDYPRFMQRFSADGVTDYNVQLATELAQQINNKPWSEKVSEIYTGLLEHPNVVVNEVALSGLKNHSKPNSYDDVLRTLIIKNEQKEASVRLSAIEALNNGIEDFMPLAIGLSSESDYLLIKRFKILEKGLSDDQFLTELENHIRSDNRMEVLFAMQALDEWWSSHQPGEKNSSNIDRVRESMFYALDKGDRSVAYVAAPLLQNRELVNTQDYERFESILSLFKLPEDIEVYQAMGAFLKNRFEDQARQLIDSLAAVGNIALNNTLTEQGWEIEESSNSEDESFRSPDWHRLLELGKEPVWVLETDKGTIRIKMDIWSAPATISGMDSLTLAGAYDNIAFHRVVPNFVVQGGDVETGDGFGGPDYVVPTEASEKQYRRGVVGIASAGTDTEGSQFFIMHQWAPHLNGRYTIIGEVIEGMKVVDRMMVGDKVLRAYWQEN